MWKYGLPLLALTLITGPVGAEPVRLTSAAFGTRAEIEVRDMPKAEATAAARAALHEIFDISQLLDAGGALPGGFGTLNAAAGQEPVALEPRIAELLRRSLQFCLWTHGAHGPLGGELYRLWGDSPPDLRQQASRPWDTPQPMPDPTDLRDAVISAQCDRLSLEFQDTGARAALAAGSRAEAIGLGRGFALDRAAEVLQEAGVKNAWLEIDSVWRAMGSGPSGQGWIAILPRAPGQKHPIDRIWLHDQSLAIVTIDPNAENVNRHPIDQRTGVPALGVFTVVTVTEQAIDAEALAMTLFVTGLREGQMLLGGLSPRPSVLWLLGQGKGEPLESAYRWSELDRLRRLY